MEQISAIQKEKMDTECLEVFEKWFEEVKNGKGRRGKRER